MEFVVFLFDSLLSSSGKEKAGSGYDVEATTPARDILVRFCEYGECLQLVNSSLFSY